jgi:two-component system response regulator RegX3
MLLLCFANGCSPQLAQLESENQMADKGHLLVVDDDGLLLKTLRVRLEQDGYRVGVAETGDAALDYAAHYLPDLVILDIGLPDSDGLDICRALQHDRPVPVIFLTGRASDIDKVSGMALGDDYVTKPFRMIELEARIAMVRRRVRRTSQASPGEVIEMAGIRLDPARHQVTVRGQPIELSPKEFGLLHLFMQHAGQVLSSNEILSVVWGPEYAGANDLVYVHVSWLRQKLSVDPQAHQLIHTVRRIGYRFVPEGS